MRRVDFLDKGFEKAVREKIQVPTRELFVEDLMGINGILVREGTGSGFGVPWQADSSAFNMIFPNFMFNVNDSENGLWELDLIHFLHIETLHLYESTQDLGFLKDFTNLKELYVHRSKTKDWTFLEELTSLCFLYLRECTFKDLTPLRDLNRNQERLNDSKELMHRQIKLRLENLALNYCGISDISPLAECKFISDLNLSHNDISDIRPLKEILSLYYLTLRYNKLTDISSLKDWKGGVYYFNVRHNQISDISFFSQMEDKHISRLFLGHNPIKDYSPAYQLELIDHDIEGYPELY